MSEVFKLPLASIRESGYGNLSEWRIGDKGKSIPMAGCTNPKFVDAICEAVNSHDTHLSDIQLLLDRHRKAQGFIDYIKSIKTRPDDSPKFLHSVIEQARKMARAIDHQAVAELREKYPKGGE